MSDEQAIQTEQAEIEIQVDLSKMTFDDLEKVANWSGDNAPLTEMLPLLRRVIVGGIGHLPITDMPKIMTAFQRAFEEVSNPKN